MIMSREHFYIEQVLLYFLTTIAIINERYMQQLHSRWLQSSQGLSWINEQSNTIQVFKILNESESRDPAKYHTMHQWPPVS